MCFLRSEGLAVEAQVLEETEFAAAEARAREVSGNEFEADSILKTLLAEEQERVSEAVAFAEVLVPMLVKRLSGLVALPSAASPAPRAAKMPAHDESRGIADFIEDMLAQERTASR
jgi:hypothetical protein